MSRLSKQSSYFLIALFLVACASVRNDPQTGKPYREPTKFEQAVAINLVAAQMNNSLSKGIIRAHESGLLPPGVAAKVLTTNKRFAELDNEITAILEQGEAISKARGGELLSKLDSLAASLTDHDSLNNLGIKNPDTQEDFQTSAAGIRALVGQVTELLRQAGVIQ